MGDECGGEEGGRWRGGKRVDGVSGGGVLGAPGILGWEIGWDIDMGLYWDFGGDLVLDIVLFVLLIWTFVWLWVCDVLGAAGRRFEYL